MSGYGALGDLALGDVDDDLGRNWFAPLRDPVRRAGLAAAIIASGAVISPWALTQAEAVTIDRWQRPLNEPVRVRPALPTGEHQVLAFVEAAPFAERTTPDRWFTPFSEPVRQRPGLAVQSQQALAFVKASPFPETVSLDRWHLGLSEPVRVRPALPIGQQLAAVLVEFAPFAETVTADRWARPFSEPSRSRPALPAGEQQALAFLDAAPFVDALTWGASLSEPMRLRGQTASYDQVMTLCYAGSTPIVVTNPEWIIRARRRLRR